MLGDCLLHLEHHEIKADCWDRVMDYFLHEPSYPNGVSVVDRYKLDYEEGVLYKLVHPH